MIVRTPDQVVLCLLKVARRFTASQSTQQVVHHAEIVGQLDDLIELMNGVHDEDIDDAFGVVEGVCRFHRHTDPHVADRVAEILGEAVKAGFAPAGDKIAASDIPRMREFLDDDQLVELRQLFLTTGRRFEA